MTMSKLITDSRLVELMQEVERDQIPSVENHDALPLIRRGWAGLVIGDAARPSRVLIFTLSTEGTIALRDHQAAEAGQAAARVSVEGKV
jgi:hypothetical protein